MDRRNRQLRGRQGWVPSDTWNLDGYLAALLADALTYLRDHGHGHPGNITQETWDGILAEMVEGFAAWRDHDTVASVAAEDEAYRKLRRSLRLMHRWYGHLWD